MTSREALALFAIVVAACSEASSHIYPGRLYEPARDCLEHGATLDVVDGPPAATTCAPACLVGAATADAGPVVYVSTTCRPYPPALDTSGANPSCTAALAAYARDDSCLPDSGSTNPIADSGAD